MTNYGMGPRTFYDKGKWQPTEAAPFVIPRGYSSRFAEMEASLTELWKDEKKFLRGFAAKKVTSRMDDDPNVKTSIFNKGAPKPNPAEAEFE